MLECNITGNKISAVLKRVVPDGFELIGSFDNQIQSAAEMVRMFVASTLQAEGGGSAPRDPLRNVIERRIRSICQVCNFALLFTVTSFNGMKRTLAQRSQSGMKFAGSANQILTEILNRNPTSEHPEIHG